MPACILDFLSINYVTWKAVYLFLDMRKNISSSFTVSKFVTSGLSLTFTFRRFQSSILLNLSFLCLTTVGPGGSGAQCFSPAVCLWEAEGAAGLDGGPRLWGADGDCGHRARQAAPGVPPRTLNPIYNPLLPYPNIFAQCYPPPNFWKCTEKANNLPDVWTPNPTFPTSTHAMPYLYSNLALSTVLS